MNALMNRSFFLLAATTAMTILLSTPNAAFAQRDAGAKARGEFGTGFWNTKQLPVSRSPLAGNDHRATPATSQASQSTASYGVNTTAQTTAKCCQHTSPPSGGRAGVAKTPKKAPWQYPKSDPRRYRP